MPRLESYDTCPNCGRSKRPGNRLCFRCQRRGPPVQVKLIRDRYFEVEFCPHKDFSKGARFLINEFRDGLRLGIWPLGMTIRHSQSGKKYVVCGDGKAYLNPAPLLPRQRLEQLRLLA